MKGVPHISYLFYLALMIPLIYSKPTHSSFQFYFLPFNIFIKTQEKHSFSFFTSLQVLPQIKFPIPTERTLLHQTSAAHSQLTAKSKLYKNLYHFFPCLHQPFSSFIPRSTLLYSPNQTHQINSSLHLNFERREKKSTKKWRVMEMQARRLIMCSKWYLLETQQWVSLRFWLVLQEMSLAWIQKQQLVLSFRLEPSSFNTRV